MTPAAVVIIISRPRPQQANEETQITVMADSGDTIATILRRAADEQECGPTLPPSE